MKKVHAPPARFAGLILFAIIFCGLTKPVRAAIHSNTTQTNANACASFLQAQAQTLAPHEKSYLRLTEVALKMNFITPTELTPIIKNLENNIYINPLGNKFETLGH